MRNLIQILSDYYYRTDFRNFQNTFSREIYDTLGFSYSRNDNEVSMVTEMCNSVNGKSFDKLKFYSKKIHGSRSYVEFFNRDKPVTTELADMVIISIATMNKNIVYEKIAFIQNKKANSNDIWDIDENQLYLLHNFPSFKGSKGIFKRNYKDEIIFLNNSQTLGNYGLFINHGEMILLNALTVFKLQQNNKLKYYDIRKSPSQIHNNDFGITFPFIDHPFFDEKFHRFLKHFPKYGFPLTHMPFLNNHMVSLNIYEFIRNWTLFNIGEVASISGDIIDNNLSEFIRLLLKQLGLSNVINLNVEGEDNFNNDSAILVSHLILDEG